jgi:RNA polymerase sigma factor (sigma-70 family)
VLNALADGDSAAWSAMVSRYGRLLRHVCRQLQMTSEQTDDVVQHTWTALFIHARNIRSAEALAGWLVTTTRRECVAVRRRDAREVPTDECGYDSPGIVIDIDEQLDALPRRRQLRRAVALLPPRERSLIEVLLEPEVPSYTEIGRRLGMPVGAIGPVRQRALRRLRDRLTDSLADVTAETTARASA